MKLRISILTPLTIIPCLALSSYAQDIAPSRSEIIEPIKYEKFTKAGTRAFWKQGGNPRKVNGYQVFDGAQDGRAQVDPQIAVGANHVLHATNHGLVIFDKKGNFIDGARHGGFKGGIDPKLFFTPHHQVYGYNTWNPWDKEKKKPVNINISATNDPTGAWNLYPVPAPKGVDGGGIGYSKKWVTYGFPGGQECAFVFSLDDAKAGKPVKVYHFGQNFGYPVMNQDPIEEVYFLKLSNTNLILTQIRSTADGSPVATTALNIPHKFPNFGWPPASAQKGSKQRISSGDRNPKNMVIQSGCLWFSQTVNIDGRAGIQWHQIDLKTGKFIQTGIIKHPKNNYIQTTLAVNKNNDVLIGFQEAGADMFVSPRAALHRAGDAPGSIRGILKFGEGKGASGVKPWGDYSGSTVDMANMTDLWTIQSITDKKGGGDTVILQVPIKEKK